MEYRDYVPVHKTKLRYSQLSTVLGIAWLVCGALLIVCIAIAVASVYWAPEWSDRAWRTAATCFVGLVLFFVMQTGSIRRDAREQGIDEDDIYDT